MLSFEILINIVFLFNDLMMVSIIYFQLKQKLEEDIIRVPWCKFYSFVVVFLFVFLCFFTPIMIIFDKSQDESGKCHAFSITLNRAYIIVVLVFIFITLVFHVILMIRVMIARFDEILDKKNKFLNMIIFFAYQLIVYILVFIKVLSQSDNDFLIIVINFAFPLRGLANALYFLSLLPHTNQQNQEGENALENELL